MAVAVLTLVAVMLSEPVVPLVSCDEAVVGGMVDVAVTAVDTLRLAVPAAGVAAVAPAHQKSRTYSASWSFGSNRPHSFH